MVFWGCVGGRVLWLVGDSGFAAICVCVKNVCFLSSFLLIFVFFFAMSFSLICCVFSCVCPFLYNIQFFMVFSFPFCVLVVLYLCCLCLFLLSSGGPPMLQSGGESQQWPTSGRIGYTTPAIWGFPNASERGDQIRIGSELGRLAT